MLRVAAYCRVSTDKEDQQNSLENQRTYFENYIISQKGWGLVGIYYDEGVSGTSVDKRFGFQRMINDAMAGKIDRILTKEVSRFARNTVDTLSYARSLKEIGVGVFFINDNLDSLDKDGEFRLTIMASVAQEESRKTSERVKWGQMRQMEKGVVFGRSMLGYDVKDGKITIEPKGAEIVRQIFQKYVYENKGTHVIARELIEQGMRPMRVKEWSNTVILRVLRNEKYVGDLCQKKTYTPDYTTHKKKYNRGQEEKVFIANHHEPIIDRITWDRAQEILASRQLTDEQKSRHSCRYWCSGKIVCGACGERYVSRVKKLSRNGRYKAWKCYANAKHGGKKINSFGEVVGCDNHSVNESVLLEGVKFVLGYLKFNRKKLIAEMKSELKAILAVPCQAADTYDPKAEIAQINQKKVRLLDSHLMGIVSAADYKQQNQHYDEEIATLQERVRAAENEHFARKVQANQLEECIRKIEQYLDFETANEQVCGEVLDKITVMGAHTLSIKLKYVAPVTLRYATSGRGENYHAEFEVVGSMLS